MNGAIVGLITDTGDRAGFSRFTFPVYRGLLQCSGSIAIGLWVRGERAGLALATLWPVRRDRAELLSIFVESSFRRLGFGVRLLEAMDQCLAEHGCRAIHASVTGSYEGSTVVERLLARSDWCVVRISAVLLHAEIATALQVPWLMPARLPPGLEVIPWQAIDDSRRAEVRRRLRDDPLWAPATLNPFEGFGSISPCSVGMIHRGRVAGWSIAYERNSTTICRGRLWVERDLQRMGRAIPLLAESLRRAGSLGIRNSYWSVAAENERMIRLLDRRIRPWLVSAKPVWEVTKQLSPEGRSA